MAWKVGKTLKSKKPYRRWSANHRGANAEGMRTLYKGHVRSMGSVKADANFEDSVTTAYQHLPKSLAKKVALYSSIPEGSIPPVIASLAKGRVLITQDSFRQFIQEWNSYTFIHGNLLRVHMMFSGAKAYFVEEDNIYNTIRRSVIYKRDAARRIVDKGTAEDIIWIEKLSLPVIPPN